MKTSSKVILLGTSLMLPLATFAKGVSTTSGAKSTSGTSTSTGTTTTGTTGSSSNNSMNSGSTTNSAVGNSSTTGTTGTSNVTPGTGAASGNTNNTGTTVYDNGTGTNVPLATTTGNPQTRTTVKPNSANAAQMQQLSLKGIQSADNTKILQLARDAGAVNPRIENGTLKYSGGTFNQQKFSSSVSSSYPDITINSTTTTP